MIAPKMISTFVWAFKYNRAEAINPKTINKSGKMMNNSFLQYKIPTRLDVGNIRVDFESSYEPTGPFGAKSIGEIVINTPSPALANAVYNATKVNIRNLPITSEKIVMGMLENEN